MGSIMPDPIEELDVTVEFLDDDFVRVQVKHVSSDYELIRIRFSNVLINPDVNHEYIPMAITDYPSGWT